MLYMDLHSLLNSATIPLVILGSAFVVHFTALALWSKTDKSEVQR